MTTIRISDDTAESARWLDSLLDAHAETNGTPFSLEYIALECVEDGERLGGLTAKVGREWIFLELFALDPKARRRGIGGQLLAALEKFGSERGKTGIWLDTYSFQAPEFYEKQGYTEVGRIPDYPHGHERRFYAKRLDGKPVQGPFDT